MVPALEISERIAPGFLGKLIQVCVVTRDYRKTAAGLLKAGIGPWRSFTFDKNSCTELTYHGRPADFSMKLCLARMGTMNWEIIQPLHGPSIHQDFLDRHGEGVHHVAFDCNDIAWEEKVAGFRKAGYEMIQSGRWLDVSPWGYFATEDDTTTIFEVWNNPADWQRPEPDEVFE